MGKEMLRIKRHTLRIIFAFHLLGYTTAILSEAAETETLLFIQPTYTFNGKCSYTPLCKNGLKCTNYDQTYHIHIRSPSL